MEIASAKLISDLGMEEYPTFFHQDDIDPLDELLDGLDFQSFSSESCYQQVTQNNHGSYTEASYHADGERSAKQLKTNSWFSCTAEHVTSNASPLISSQIISFGSSAPAPAISQLVSSNKYTMNPRNEPRTPLHSQEHLVAERKRREKLSQRLIALSALVPGLKKTDKASVLGDAVKYLKELQERVKALEEQAAKKTMESMIVVKKSQLCIDDHEIFSSDSSQFLPEIEARVADRKVLIRIHCEKNEECIVNVLKEIEKNDLTVVKSNILPFGNFTLDITIVAQMDVEFAMTMKDLVENLRLALLHPSDTKSSVDSMP